MVYRIPFLTSFQSTTTKFITWLRSPDFIKYLCSTHFWGPVSNFGIPLAAITDLKKDPKLISGKMTTALIIYSAVFARYAWMVSPRNYLLLGCHIINEITQICQGSHSVFKTQFLKKKEGESLLRRDIQYEFLDLVVNNDQEVFTLPQGATHKKVTFGELYVTYVQKSPKTSKVLREKLENDRTLAMALVMVALLVNIGRINTTLVFTHTQTRTYNPIPSLQAYSNDKVKVLQDAPRLKGILKFYSEDLPEHLAWQSLLDAQKSQLRPSTNPINLIFVFVLCSSKISSLHFNSSFEFIDLFTKASFSSKSRARAFLWLCWHYLETDGSAEVAMRNPFNYGNTENPLKAPNLDSITEEEAALENIDTPIELEYAIKMAEERKRYLQENENLRSNSQNLLNIRRKSRTREMHKKDDTCSPPEFPKLLSNVENQDEYYGNTLQEDFNKKQPRVLAKAKKRKAADTFYNSGDEGGNYTSISNKQVNSNLEIIEQQKHQNKKPPKQQFKKEMKKHHHKKRKQGAILREWKKYTLLSPLEDSDGEDETDQEYGEYIVSLITSLKRAHRRASKYINQKLIFTGKESFDWKLSESNSEKTSIQGKDPSSISFPPSEHPKVGVSAHAFEDLQHLRTCLLTWYKSNARTLPWRKSYVAPPTILMSREERMNSLQRAYEVLVSEMMLQQTQVITVIPYFKRWMKRFPTWETLVTADLEEIQTFWAGLGYYSRARRLKEAAIYILELEKKNQLIPTDVESWVKNVPGCGEYTAGAVLSIAWNIRCPIVDGNVIRVLTRLRAVGADCRKGEGKRWIWDFADQIVDDQQPGDFNQALMELGATICTPVNPNCKLCPLNKDCLALEEAKIVLSGNGNPPFKKEHSCDLCPIEELKEFTSIKTYISGKYPRKTVKKHSKIQESIVLVITREKNEIKEYYLEKRPSKGLLAGLWDFKTLLIEEGCENRRKEAENYTKRIILNEVVKFQEKSNTIHQFTHIKQISHVYLIEVSACANVSGKGCWMSEEMMKNHSIPELTWKNFRQAINNEKRMSSTKRKNANKRIRINNDGMKQTTLFSKTTT
ncbi:hypothetical protein PCANB_000961 [Pneumocystis canis]|nr:hypothetical protein PCANB_000961 [Pneumocystis canis]